MLGYNLGIDCDFPCPFLLPDCTNPDIWGDDVGEFKPERWGEGRPLWEARWQHQAFYGGPRMCPAQQMVLTQVAYLSVRLAQEFKGLENRDEVHETLGGIYDDYVE
jgi:cytochrome P450